MQYIHLMAYVLTRVFFHLNAHANHPHQAHATKQRFTFPFPPHAHLTSSSFMNRLTFYFSFSTTCKSSISSSTWKHYTSFKNFNNIYLILNVTRQYNMHPPGKYPSVLGCRCTLYGKKLQEKSNKFGIFWNKLDSLLH